MLWVTLGSRAIRRGKKGDTVQMKVFLNFSGEKEMFRKREKGAFQRGLRSSITCLKLDRNDQCGSRNYSMLAFFFLNSIDCAFFLDTGCCGVSIISCNVHLIRVILSPYVVYFKIESLVYKATKFVSYNTFYD